MKRKFAAFLALLLIACLLLGISSLAAAEPTPKREVVYARLAPDGAVQGVYVVNSFELTQPGTVTDLGAYTQVTNLTTMDPITAQGGAITCDVSRAGRFYYQGNLESRQLPWTIDLTYTLNGAAIQPDALAGASGVFGLELRVGENEACSGPWFASCALSVTVTLDGDLCSNVASDKGVVAASGGDLLVSFTILPGTQAVCSLTADVTAFQMDSIQFAGVPMELDMDLNSMDLSQVTGSLTQLTHGIDQLADGAKTLSGGTADLADGAGELKDGADTIAEHAQTLLTGMEDLNAGVTQLQAGLTTLTANNAQLTQGATQLSDGLAEVAKQLDGFSDFTTSLTQLTAGSTAILDGVEQLADGLNQLEDGYDAYTSGMEATGTSALDLAQANTDASAQVDAAMEQYSSLIGLLAADPQYAGLADAVANLQLLLAANAQVLTAQDALISQSGAGVGQLSDGASKLAAQYKAFDSAIQAIPAQLSDLGDGITALQTGLTALAEGAAQLSDGIADYTDGVADIADGYTRLASGYGDVVEGYASLAEGLTAYSGGVTTLAEGTASLTQGAAQLSDGLAQLQEQTAGLDDSETLQTYANQLLDSFTGSGSEAVSFVSPDNTGIQAVQFVFMTQGIHVQVPEAGTVQAQTQTFLDRLLALFGGD